MTGPDDSDGGSRGPRIAYPLEYTFKVIGLAGDDFAEHARRLVARVVGDVAAEKVTVRASAAGKYHSVSVVARLASEDERRAVYQALHDDPRVVYYL